MVREDQVGAAALDVELGTEQAEGDRRALDVPAGPAQAEGGIPGGLTGPLPTPDQAVQRMLLPGPLRVAATFGEQRHRRCVAQTTQRAEVAVTRRSEIQIRVPRVVHR